MSHPRRRKMVSGKRKSSKKKAKRRKLTKRTRPRGFTTAAEQGSSRGTMTTIPRGIKAMWPDILRTTMVWYKNTGDPFTEGVTQTGGQNYLSIRGNSVFDPNVVAGPQGQPAGFDDMAAKYARYRVLASSIVVQAFHSDVPIQRSTAVSADFITDRDALRTEMLVCADNLPILTGTVNRDARYEGRFKTSGPWKRKWINNINPGLGKKTIKLYCSTSNALDIGFSEIQSDNKYAAAIDADPEELWFWSVNFIGDTGLYGGRTRICDVKCWVKYYVQFEERIVNIPQS